MPLFKYFTRSSVIILIVFLLLCVATGRALAAIEPYQQKIQGLVKKGDTLVVKDEKFENSAYNWDAIHNNSVLNMIVFKLNNNALAGVNKSFSCKTDLKVEYWSQPGQEEPITIEHVKLTINYDTATGAVYQQVAQYDFSNAYKIKVTVNDISSDELSELPAIFMLEAHVVVNRDYLPQSGKTLIPMVDIVEDEQPVMQGMSAMSAMTSVIITANAVKVSWDLIPGAQKYDLEWTFVDEESANGAILAQAGSGATMQILAPMFRNNSTRITVENTDYTISLVHNNKYLLIRMRTVDESAGYRNEGTWSYQISSGGVVSPAVVVLPTTWHQPGLNWQYDATYAEEGKKKEVVNYFDGTLRNRQTVTVNNSDKVAIVQENVYDQYGRPVANILPAPTGSGILNFFPTFNKNAAGTTYTAANVFKGLTGACIGLPDPLKTESGASKYYSISNEFLATDALAKYIPDAEGYPLAVTSYAPDNTGRIAVKGGVGLTMQPSTNVAANHTTRYYYGKPEQWELDRLFGNDAGYADHYLKNMVIDPNGQISISYQNAAGKTVATALTGSTPDTSLLALPSKPAAVKKNMVLLQPERFVFDPGTLKLTATTTYLASVPDPTASFTFSMDRLIKKYVQGGVTICSNCYYDVKVIVNDDCNNRILNIANVKRGSALSDCNLTSASDTTFTVALNKIGEYYITFELALNPNVIEYYTNDFIARNTNLKTQFQFAMEQLKREDFTGCFSECTTCRETLGTKPGFMTALKIRISQNGIDTVTNLAAINTWAGGLYDALYSNCQTLRTSCLASPCDKLENILLNDVSPGGQYAMFSNGVPMETNINVIYNNWRKPDVFPIKQPGNTDYEAAKFQLQDGSYTSPYDESFTLDMLVNYWRTEWAEKFLAYHPEKCALTFCGAMNTYKSWDQRVEKIYNTTADIPLIKAGLAYDISNGSWLLAADPFFTGTGAGTAYYAAFKADLDNYAANILHISGSGVNNKSLSQYVDYLLYCGDGKGNTNVNASTDLTIRWNQCSPVASCRIPDKQWQTYANLYLELKEKYYQILRDANYCQGICTVGAYPVISPGNKPTPPVPYRTCADFNLSMFTKSGNVGTVTIWPPANMPIPAGLLIDITYYANGGNWPADMPYDVQFVAGSGPQSFTLKSGQQITWSEYSCTGTPTNPPSPCAVDYWSKTSRLNNYKYNEVLSVDTAAYLPAARDSLKLQIQRSCEVTVDLLMKKLEGCSALTAGNKPLLRTRLIEVCALGGDETHINGSSNAAPGKVNTDGDATFEQVLKRYLNVTSLSMLCNPWLIDVPYPYNVSPQTVTRSVGATDSTMCARLNALKLEQQNTQPGTTFFNYLVAKYGSGMSITSVELDALMKGCNNCRYLLDREVTLPVFLDGTTKGCITATEFWAVRAAFAASVGATGDTSAITYKNIYRNYLNQRWGFSLTFSDYDNFRKLLQTSPTATLCNSPVYSTLPADPYQCMYDLVDGAIEGAKRSYTMYIDSVKQDFRKQYIDICSAVRSKVSLNTSQQIYHYTLYYYDQAGNLLRTVPPEGVDLIEEPEKLDWVDRSRRAEYSQCTYTGPQANTNEDATLDKLGVALIGASQSVEMWLYNADGGGAQVLANAGDKAYFNVCIDGSYLHADVYKLAPPVTGSAEIIASNSIDVNISALLPLNPWTHVVLQGPDLDESGVISVFVNGVSCPAVSNAPQLGCGWDITAAATGSAIFAENLTYLRQLRMYKRLMSVAEIAANAKENCMGMAAAYSAALLADTISWGRFNTPLPGTATTLPDGGTTEVQTSAVYPRHRLSTDYAYNSLGQVVQQNSPDANTSYFWYDQKGRLFASRNANQYLGTNQFSYTEYDNLGRITEVGEKKNGNSLGVPAFIADATVNLFLNSGTNSQITRTFYDVAPDALYTQDNLRKRVSASQYLETEGTVEQASYYSYDALGNVKTLWQKLYGLHEVKKIDYNYDLVSGKVNAVRYQQAKPDQFFYNYAYDAENRLVEANSGIAHNGSNWTISPTGIVTDAHYYYYKHGPLARARIGKNNAQGIDYAYTLQGWLKAINGTGLTPANDIGQDGQTGSGNSTFAKDVMAYSLDYFTGDYKPIGTTANALAVKYAATATDITGQNLFNGNISRTTVALSKLNSGNPVGYSYRYDQLNRLIRMRQHPLTAIGTWGLSQRVEDNQEDISYDGNGNILSYFRNGTHDVSLPMDNLSYYYPIDQAGNLTANTLRHIKETVAPGTYNSDLDDMPDDNYTYDKIGNLIKDQSASITNIAWSVYGKIKSITFSDGSSLMYKYDASGNRIYKEYTKSGTVNKTWYVKDAQGNSLAVYGNNGGTQTYWKEQHLYGSSRLGMWMPEIAVTGTVGNPATAWSQINLTRYELNNHLGNTLGVISDQQVGLNATVYNMSDYAPFGMQMVGRTWNLGAGRYRYGFNGKENDNEVKGEGNQIDYGMRIYDPRVGKFLSVDPLQKQYPELTPYQFTANNPIENVDLDGKEIYDYRLDLDDKGHKTGFVFLGKNVGTPLGWTIFDLFGMKIPSLDVYQSGKFVGTYSFNTASQGGLNVLRKVAYDEDYRNEFMNTVQTDGQKQTQHAEEIGNTIGEGFQTAATVNYAMSRVQSAPQRPTNSTAATQRTNKQATAAQGGNTNAAEVNTESNSFTRVGRWMQPKEYAAMKSTGRIQEGAGGMTFTATSGPASFRKQAASGSVYVEFDVPSNSLLQGGQSDWFKTIGGGANAAMKYQLKKQGGTLNPEVKNISEVKEKKD
ncbi:RHS repeat-associated core domain-containing protein [Chitinophaga sp. W2I13]|uniref:TreTu family toxin n=1 Tax=Chitinophaga sp. W2I13 TaxID=3373923 RepID=UPI003D1EE3F4